MIVPKLRVASVYGHHLSLLGIDGSISTADYGITREWTLRIMRHPAQVDGLLIVGRHENTETNLVLFGRPRTAGKGSQPRLKGLIRIRQKQHLKTHPQWAGAVSSLELRLA